MGHYWSINMQKLSLAIMICLALAFALSLNTIVLASTFPQAKIKAYNITVETAKQQPINLFIKEQGEGEPIVLLHGLGASHYMWRYIQSDFSKKYRMIAVDMKGFGLSEKPIDWDYKIEDHAEIVKALIKKLKLKNITVIGHSFGGAVALLLALDSEYQKQPYINRLVLMDSPAFPQTLSPGVKFLQTPLFSYLGLNVINPQRIVKMTLRGLDGKTDFLSEQDIKAYAAPFKFRGARHALVQTARNIEPQNFKRMIKAYKRMDIPTLLVWCRHDPVVPVSIGKRLKKTLPDAKLKIIDNCRHVPTEQAPEKTQTHIMEFLEQTQIAAFKE